MMSIDEVRAMDGRRKGRSRSSYLRDIATRGGALSPAFMRQAHTALGNIAQVIAELHSDYIVEAAAADELDRIDAELRELKALMGIRSADE